MKRLLSIILSLSLVLSFSFTAFAAEPSLGTEKTVESEGYTFTINEKVDSNHRVTRTYKADGISTRSVDTEKVKAVLLALGMEQDVIDGLSSETLEIYANSAQITTTTTYSKLDEFNNLTYLDEETALSESSELQAIQEANFLQGIAPAATYQDSYMKLLYTVSDEGSGSFLFSTDATWLTMPFFRGVDSIGSCAMNGTVTNSTRSGNFSYEMTTIVSGKTTTTTQTGTISSSNFKNAVNGNWYGSAGILNLPSDFYGDTTSTLIKNYKAHYQYQGHVTSPSVESYFNTIGSYSHATVAVSTSSPSVSISLSTGEVSASIGLAITGAKDTRSAETEIHFVP